MLNQTRTFLVENSNVQLNGEKARVDARLVEVDADGDVVADADRITLNYELEDGDVGPAPRQYIDITVTTVPRPASE